MIIHNTPDPIAMTDADFKAQLKQQLPDLLRQDSEIRALVLQTVDHYFANRQDTDSRFDRVLAELQRDPGGWPRYTGCSKPDALP